MTSLSIAVNGGVDDSDAAIATWEADLAQGAVAERMASGQTDLADVIGSSKITIVYPDGHSVDAGGGAGDVVAGQVFQAQRDSATDAQISAGVNATLSSFGLSNPQIVIVRPLGPAVEVIVTAHKAQLVGKVNAIMKAIEGDPAAYEGVYFEADAPDGTPLARVSTALRSGAGRMFVAPSLDGRIGVEHGGLMTRH